MARNETLDLVAGAWTQATNANITAIRVHNFGDCGVLRMQATVGAVPPVSVSGSLPLDAGETLAADLTLAELWPGVVGANRLYLLAEKSGRVSVSHADG